MSGPTTPWKKLVEEAMNTIYDKALSGSGLVEGLSSIIGEDSKLKTETDLLNGILMPSEAIAKLASAESLDEISVKVREIVQDILTSPLIREFSETMGVLMTEPFIAVLENYAEQEEVDGKEFSAAFHGATMLLTMPSVIAEAMRGNVVGLALGPFGEAMKSIYWNLGLGFLGWQTLAPLLSTGLQPRMDRYYNKKFMPKRFDLDTYVYLYNTDQITASELIEEGRGLGWNPADIQTLINNSYRTLSRSDMSDLVAAGKMTLNDVHKELLKQGYEPSYIPTFAQNIVNETRDDAKLPSLSTARNAYYKGLMSTSDFISLLRSLGYSEQAINLEVSIAHDKLAQERRELSISQVKAAFTEGTISKLELTNFLREYGYDSVQINLLTATWEAQKAPPVLKLNKGTIVQALTRGVLSEGQASSRLIALGYTVGDVRVILDTALASGATTGHTISISKLIDAMSIGVISEAEFTARLKGRGITNADINIYLSLAKHEDVKTVSEGDVHDAYLYGLLDNAGASRELTTLGFEQRAITLKVDTWEEERNRLRVKLTPGIVILYYRQGLVSKDQMTRRFIELGFSNEDAQLMTQSADLSIPRELSTQEIEDLYFTGVITSAKAQQALQNTGLSAVDAQLVIKSWQQIKADLNPRPTVSQFLKALRDGLLSESEFIQNLNDLGYTDKIIAFYLRLTETPEVEVTKSLTKADILGLQEDGLLTYENALERLIGMGYDSYDAELLLARNIPDITKSEVHKLFLNGYIPPEEYYGVLLALGYSEENILDYLTSIGL